MILHTAHFARNLLRHFRIVEATTERDIQETFRIRHEVYAEELGFEPVSASGIETDEYDSRSRHFMLQEALEPHRPVGCARIILAGADPLPIEVVCAKTIDLEFAAQLREGRARLAEVSRLAVRKTHRRRKGEAGQAVALCQEDFPCIPSTRMPFIPIGLFIGAIAVASRAGIDSLVFLVEPRMMAHLLRLGVGAIPIGGPVEHRGVRIPVRLQLGPVMDCLDKASADAPTGRWLKHGERRRSGEPA